MAFNSNFTDELRARLSILDVVGAVVPLTRKGNQYWGYCPFHNEKTPSFSVREDWGKYHCFGCSESGDIISFTMKTKNLEFRAALEELAKMAGIKMPDYKPKTQQQIDSEKSYLEIHAAAAKIYSEKLFSPDGEFALNYVRNRGFTDEMIKKYGIGYAPKNNIVSARLGAAPGVQKTGLVRSGDYGQYDFFREKLMFPIFDERGFVVAFSGRSLDGSEPKYINTGETEFFHKGKIVFGLNFAKNAIHKNNRSIVVEGQIDAIQMQCNGFGETVAPLGTALTADHLAILCKSNRNLVFCFDGDGAGAKAAARAVGLVMPLIRDNSDVRFAFVSGGKDPDDILRGPDGAARMKKIIDSAIPLADFIKKDIGDKFVLGVPGGQAQAKKYLQKLTEQITDPALRAAYSDEFKLWRGAPFDKTAVKIPTPAVGNLEQKTLSHIVFAFPELAEKYYDFISSCNIAAADAKLNLSAADAEKFIVVLKLQKYIKSLQAARSAAHSDFDEIKKIDSQIAAANGKLNKLTEM
ncbi:MAG: DNA primase [Rickettsiales bacterium]|jgi:DNA primase|nr:DNA primase [Rickettsiales bacterium]